MQALAIEMKSIFKNNEVDASDNLVDDDRLIWQIKSKILFDMLLSVLKSMIRQIIKNWIDENSKNAAELWTALETEYKTHTADTRLELVQKFSTISMNDYNKDVQTYISDFQNICEKLKTMKFKINTWIKNDKFITDLQNH